MRDDAAVGIKQVNLHARVYRHQFVEQLMHRTRVQALRLHQCRVAGDVRGQATRQALHHLLLVALVGAHLQCHGHTAASQQQRSEDQRQALRQRHARDHGAASASL